MKTALVFAVSFFAFALCLPDRTLAASRAATTPDLDKVTFHAASVPRAVPLVLRTFDASTAELGTGADTSKPKKHEAATTLQEISPAMLATAFQAQAEKLGVFSSVAVLGAEDPVPEGAVLVDGRFTVLNPGSKGKRYWVGMGAGKAKVCFAGRVLAPDGSPAAEFEHCRVGTIGFVGGDATGMMATDVRKGGVNLADFVTHLAEGRFGAR